MKRFLGMGTRYVGTNAELAGTENDVHDWGDAVEARGFDEVVKLLGNDCTRQRMLEEMTALVQETGPDDLAVIQWSGHGTWRVDRDGDEPDRRDEMICPDDYARSGHIADDDLYRVFTSGHRWARIVFISDSCHSGSVNRLAGPLSPPTSPITVATGANYAAQVQFPGAYRRAKFLPPAEWMDTEDLVDAEQAQHAPSRGRPRGSALLLAACTDTQVAYDAWFNGRANGAYTYAALQALETNPATYRDWQRAINKRLPSVDYDQKPQILGGSGQRRWSVFEETGER